ncbi:MAG TPA: caspase family protein, partial [Chitinophagaceae bacterium]
IGNESFLLPAGVAGKNDSSVYTSTLSAGMVRGWSNNIPALRQLFIVDASASFFPSSFASVAPIAASSKPNSKNLGLIAANFPRIERQDLKSGIVASSLLDMLNEENAAEDKMITYKRLENHLAGQLSRTQHYLSMESYSHGRDFVIMQYDNAPLRKAKSQPTAQFITRGAEPDMPVEGEEQNKIGKRYGLFIATDEYQDSKWTALKNPVYDARELRKELEDNYGFDIKLLENPTRKEIMSVLNEYSKKEFNKNDQLVLLFAGHGFYDVNGNEGYLVTKDSRYVDMDFESSYISFTSLVRSIKNFKAQHMLMLADACHAGAICENSLTRGGEGLYDKLSHERRIQNHLENPNRIIITSGRKNEKVYDGTEGKNSPFMAAVLQALRGSEARSGALSYHQLMEYIRQMQKTEATVGRLFISDNDDFLFEYVKKTNTYKSDEQKKKLNGN